MRLLFILTFVLITGLVYSQETKTEHLTMDSFKEKVFDFEKHEEWKYQGDLPAIIDFYADWCRPCKMIEPIMEEIAHEYNGQIVVYKVDTEAEKDLSMLLGIQSLPSILFIPKEGTPQMALGYAPKETFESYIDKFLNLDATQN